MAGDTVQDILKGLLERYAARGSGESVDNFLREEMAGAGFSPAETDEALKDMTAVIESNRANYASIQAYKERGLTSTAWFRDRVDEKIASLSDKEREAFFGGLDDLGAWEDVNKDRIADHLMGEIRGTTLAHAAALENALPQTGKGEGE